MHRIQMLNDSAIFDSQYTEQPLTFHQKKVKSRKTCVQPRRRFRFSSCDCAKVLGGVMVSPYLKIILIA
jgi:hypothetical protein